MTEDASPSIIAAALSPSSYDDAQRVSTLHDILAKLPPANVEAARALFQHLHLIAEQERTNRMGMANLAMCFGPTLLARASQEPLSPALMRVQKPTEYDHMRQLF